MGGSSDYGPVCTLHSGFQYAIIQYIYGVRSLAGSSLHAVRALQYPRWEDYEYSRMDDVPNRLYWLGDGQTYNEKTLTGDSKLSAYATEQVNCSHG